MNRYFIVLVGPQAVGKMAVGKVLAQKLDLRLYHNHMSIEPVLALFDYHTQEAKYLIKHFREETMKAMANSNQKGMIFTYMMDFDLKSEYDYIDSLFSLFESKGFMTFFVELEADIETRLKRNDTLLRLSEKPSKRNLAFSYSDLVNAAKKYRLNSREGELNYLRYFRINNTDLSVESASDAIIAAFDLK